MQERKVAVRGGMFETEVIEDGDGQPLLYLHGVNGVRPGDPFLARLAQDYRVIAPRLPGFGESTGSEHLHDLHDLIYYELDLLDTLGLRDSESEPIRAGQNDDVSMHVGTGGPEEEARDSDLGKREEDVSDDEGATTGDDDSTSGISGDYDTAAETQVIPAKPEDEEAGSPPSQGDVHENGATAPPAQATAATRASGSQGGRARNVPKGAILAPEGGTCPADFPIKGNANSRIYHMPGESSYDSTIPEYCFASEEDARGAGFRPRKR